MTVLNSYISSGEGGFFFLGGKKKIPARIFEKGVVGSSLQKRAGQEMV